MIGKYLWVFLISMVPIIELRGAIPVAVGMGLPLIPSYIICIIGNMLPVPFIYFFARKVLIWGSDKPVIGKNSRQKRAEASSLPCSFSWESPFPEPELGQVPWQPAFWIWISSPASWLLCAAFSWQA